MRISAAILIGALAMPAAASAQTVVSTSSGLAFECFIHAKASIKPREGVRLCDMAFKQDRLNRRDKGATYNNRGMLLNMLDKVDRAEADFKSAISLDPSLGDPHVNLGSMLIRKKQFRDAIAQIDKGMALGMSFPQIGHYNRALAWDYLGRYPEAYADYRRTLDYDPNFKLASDRLKDFMVTRKPGQS